MSRARFGSRLIAGPISTASVVALAATGSVRAPGAKSLLLVSGTPRTKASTPSSAMLRARISAPGTRRPSRKQWRSELEAHQAQWVTLLSRDGRIRDRLTRVVLLHVCLLEPWETTRTRSL